MCFNALGDAGSPYLVGAVSYLEVLMPKMDSN